MDLKIEGFSFELRKINAMKIHCQNKESTESDKNTSEDKPKRPLHEVGIHLKQKDKDDGKIQLNVLYRVPSIAEAGIEIDAEFIGSISLNETIDIKSKEEVEKSPQFREFADKILVPKILKELDNMLSPLYYSMNVKYESMSQKTNEDACGFETPS